MKLHIRRKSLFIALFFILFMFWLFISKQNRPMADLGINIFSMVAYIVAIVWTIHSYN